MTALLIQFLPYILGGVVALIFGYHSVSSIKQAGVDQQKAKEAEARARSLDRLKTAANARPSGGVSDDPNNRDNG